MATSVRENTTDAAAIVPEATAPSNALALSTVVVNTRGRSPGSVRRSTQPATQARTAAPAIHRDGTPNRLVRNRSASERHTSGATSPTAALPEPRSVRAGSRNP